ncbi:uncharacterized protein LOC135931555 isoform X2 [Gordionus sp. m RMFG-2023]|uniref:uncharacterized protein LOC135931555 isoform X2 n=1 Tax=Gordionus sp. m RMFG-2023 TaxID=3053472 RepID=UPI0031FCCC8E
MLGTQVKIPETTNLYSQYHFQNIPKNLGPQSKTIPANFSQANQNMTETINLPASNTENTQLCGTQVKIPETTNLYSQYHFQNIPKNLGPQSITIPATIKLSSSQIISKNMLGTQVKIPETFEFSSSQNISKNILGTQIKLPNTTKTLDYTGYSLQNFFRKP